MMLIQQRSWERCWDRAEKGSTVWLATIQSECLRGVSARAANGKAACGEVRSARTFRADDSAIGVTTDRSRLVREFDFCSFDTTGPAVMIADRAERPSSGAKVTRMIRPNRTEVLLLPMLAQSTGKPPRSWTRHGSLLNWRINAYELLRRHRNQLDGGGLALLQLLLRNSISRKVHRG
jgi:hypothetical protein